MTNNNFPAVFSDTNLNEQPHAEDFDTLSRCLSRSIASLVKSGSISGPEIEALAAIAAGYDLLTAPARTARRQAAYEADKTTKDKKLARPPEEKSARLAPNNGMMVLPPLLDMTCLEQDFLAWWMRLQQVGQQACMPIVLDVAVEGLSLTKVGEKRVCDKRTARSRLLLGLRYYLAARSGDGSYEDGADDEETPIDVEASGDGPVNAEYPADLPPNPKAALKQAVTIAGGQSALARKIGTNQQNISYWLKKGVASLKFVRGIERETGVRAAQLRPDVFGVGANKVRGAESLDGVPDADLDEVRSRWADAKPRCPLCRILVTDGAPGSPCFREGCTYAVPEEFTRPIYGASSLAGDDYSVV